MNTITIAPGETLPVKLDWIRYLGKDTLSSSVFTKDNSADAISIVTQTYDDVSSVVTISDAVLNEVYVLINTVTTENGKTAVRKFKIYCREKYANSI